MNAARRSQNNNDRIEFIELLMQLPHFSTKSICVHMDGIEKKSTEMNQSTTLHLLF